MRLVFDPSSPKPYATAHMKSLIARFILGSWLSVTLSGCASTKSAVNDPVIAELQRKMPYDGANGRAMKCSVHLGLMNVAGDQMFKSSPKKAAKAAAEQLQKSDYRVSLKSAHNCSVETPRYTLTGDKEIDAQLKQRFDLGKLSVENIVCQFYSPALFGYIRNLPESYKANRLPDGFQLVSSAGEYRDISIHLDSNLKTITHNWRGGGAVVKYTDEATPALERVTFQDPGVSAELSEFSMSAGNTWMKAIYKVEGQTITTGLQLSECKDL